MRPEDLIVIGFICVVYFFFSMIVYALYCDNPKNYDKQPILGFIGFIKDLINKDSNLNLLGIITLRTLAVFFSLLWIMPYILFYIIFCKKDFRKGVNND